MMFSLLFLDALRVQLKLAVEQGLAVEYGELVMHMTWAIIGFDMNICEKQKGLCRSLCRRLSHRR